MSKCDDCNSSFKMICDGEFAGWRKCLFCGFVFPGMTEWEKSLQDKNRGIGR